MTQDYSTAHTFHYRWFVQLVKIHSNQKSDSRLVMVLLLTHLQKEQMRLLQVVLLLTETDTTEELLLKTLCKRVAYILSRDSFGGLFFYRLTNIEK